MGSPGGFAPRLLITPPEKGSFPLDHFGECLSEVQEYQKCMQDNHNTNSACHHLAKVYLKCRMDHNLMAKEDLNDLGFSKPLVPVTEEEKASYRDGVHIRDPSKEYIPGLGRIRRMNSQFLEK